MSAVGPKRTSLAAPHMSAFGLKLTSSGFACVQRHGGESRWSTGRD